MPPNRKPTPDGFYEVFYAQADIAYLVKANRIGRGYSAEELSFLIGHSKDYVAGRELALPHKDFTVLDLYTLAKLFNQFNVFFFFMRNPQELKMIWVKATLSREENRVVHRLERKRDDGENELLFQLYEYDAPLPESAIESDRKELERLVKYVGGLLRRGWFTDSRTPLEIFQRCCAGLKRDIRPRLLEKALASYTKQPNHLLERRRESGVGVYFKSMAGKE
ncbi:MAG: hypothetical protein ACO1OO_00375 [Flavisolibacter sp.]